MHLFLDRQKTIEGHSEVRWDFEQQRSHVNVFRSSSVCDFI